LEWQWYGCEQAADSAVPLERIVDTWPVDQLLGWAKQKN
jgi:putative hydrolase